MVPDAVWVRGADGTLTVIDLPAPRDDDVAQLARKMCRTMTAVVVRWQEARGEAEHFTKRDKGKLANRLVKRLQDLGFAVAARPTTAVVSI